MQSCKHAYLCSQEHASHIYVPACQTAGILEAFALPGQVCLAVLSFAPDQEQWYSDVQHQMCKKTGLLEPCSASANGWQSCDVTTFKSLSPNLRTDLNILAWQDCMGWFSPAADKNLCGGTINRTNPNLGCLAG